MKKVAIIGASGYSGAQLVYWLSRHPQFMVEGVYVSESSQDACLTLSSLHPFLYKICDKPLRALNNEALINLPEQVDIIFLATPHQASHDVMDSLAGKGAVVFDLSGAFRLQNSDLYTQHYQFEHNSHWLDKAVYGLAEHFSDPISIAELVAVPGCYPTASLTALLPVKAFIDEQHLPIINAVSGVSGAGRKAAINTSFTEVSLQAYGVHSHRHQPEISSYLQREVIFTPHLGNFKRGILATITVRVKEGVTQADIDGVFAQAYTHSTIVRIVNTWPKVDDVAGLPYCDLYWQLDEHNGYLIIASALDNLLKGAATQAIQCANLRFGLATDAGLLGRAS